MQRWLLTGMVFLLACECIAQAPAAGPADDASGSPGQAVAASSSTPDAAPADPGQATPPSDKQQAAPPASAGWGMPWWSTAWWLRPEMTRPEPIVGVHPLEAATGGSLRPMRTSVAEAHRVTMVSAPWVRATFPPPWMAVYSPYAYVLDPRARSRFAMPPYELDPAGSSGDLSEVRPRVILTGLVVEERELTASTWSNPFELPTPPDAPAAAKVIKQRTMLDTPPPSAKPAADPTAPAATTPAPAGTTPGGTKPAPATPKPAGGFFDTPMDSAAPPPANPANPPQKPAGGFFDN